MEFAKIRINRKTRKNVLIFVKFQNGKGPRKEGPTLTTCPNLQYLSTLTQLFLFYYTTSTTHIRCNQTAIVYLFANYPKL